MSRFDKFAKEWDLNPRRVRSAKAIAEGIKSKIEIENKEIADIGAGTGLLTFHLYDKAKSIDAIDNSRGMLIELENKAEQLGTKINTLCMDIEKNSLHKKYDLIVSSMTMHHIKDTASFLQKCKNALKKDGYLAIADLVTEDGTFHTRGNEDVAHFGFDKDEISNLFKQIGFEVISYKIVEIIKKHKEFPIFLIIGKL